MQLLQLQHGAAYPAGARARHDRGTPRLAKVSLIDSEDVDVLTDAYVFCERAGNAA